jgi:hypothetical protein
VKKVTGLLLIFLGTTGYAFAGITPAAPEMDASSAMAAIVLISGGMVVLWGRRRAK